MRVLVTGVTGFLGGCIAGGLKAAGHAVRGFARDPSRWTERPEDVEAVSGDIRDPASVAGAAEGCEAIVHAAALVKIWARDRREFDRVNVDGLRHVVQAAEVERARLVYASSFIALGPTDGRVFDERTPRATDVAHNDYERTKWAADRLARRLAAEGFPLVILYPGIVYGPGALTAGNHVVQSLLQHASGKLPGLLGAGDRRLSLAYVDDVVEGFVAALIAAPSGSSYILGGDNRTLKDLFDAFAKATGIPPPRLRIPSWVAGIGGRLQRWRAEWTGFEPELTEEVVEIYRHEWAYSSERAQRELGYAVTPLEEGIERTVAWLRRRGELPGRS